MVRLVVRTKEDRRNRRLAAYQQSTDAAIVIQARFRGWAARRDVALIREAVMRIQAAMRGRTSRSEGRVLNHTVLQIQRVWRGRAARNAVRSQISATSENMGAVVVQSRMRAMIQRKRLKFTRLQIIKIQAAWRGYVVRRDFRQEYDRKAQIIIQSRMFESTRVQWYLERERTVMRSKIGVYREWAHTAGKRRAVSRMRDTSAIVIQSSFRGYMARRLKVRLREQRDRNEELGKFVELLRSHMSMVIFEEKESHSLAFPTGKRPAAGGKLPPMAKDGSPSLQYSAADAREADKGRFGPPRDNKSRGSRGSPERSRSGTAASWTSRGVRALLNEESRSTQFSSGGGGGAIDDEWGSGPAAMMRGQSQSRSQAGSRKGGGGEGGGRRGRGRARGGGAARRGGARRGGGAPRPEWNDNAAPARAEWNDRPGQKASNERLEPVSQRRSKGGAQSRREPAPRARRGEAGVGRSGYGREPRQQQQRRSPPRKGSGQQPARQSAELDSAMDLANLLNMHDGVLQGLGD